MFDKKQISRGFNWWLGKQLSVCFWNSIKFVGILFVVLLAALLEFYLNDLSK